MSVPARILIDNLCPVQPTQQKTFFENAQDSLDSPLFAAFLPFQATGAYDFGATDSSRYTGDIAYTSVDNSNGWWEFPSTSYKVGSKSFTSSGYTAIAGQFPSAHSPHLVANALQTPEPP